MEAAVAMVDPFDEIDDDVLTDHLSDDAEWAQEQVEEAKQRWKIESDGQADWCLRKIAALDADDQKWKEHFERQLARIKEANEQRREYWKFLLREYFGTVPHKEAKTQQTYTLPSGKLVLKNKAPKYDPDDAELVAWMKANGLIDFIKVKEEARWGDFKKTLPKGEDGNPMTLKTEEGLRLVTADGEVVPGVSVEPQEPEFTYQLAKG